MKLWPLRLLFLAILCWGTIGAALLAKIFITPTSPLLPPWLLPYRLDSGANREFFHSIHMNTSATLLLLISSLLSTVGIVLALQKVRNHQSAGVWIGVLWSVIFTGSLLLSCYLMAPGVLFRAMG